MHRSRSLGCFTVLTMTDTARDGRRKNRAAVVGFFHLTALKKRECLRFWLTLLVKNEKPDSDRTAVFLALTKNKHESKTVSKH